MKCPYTSLSDFVSICRKPSVFIPVVVLLGILGLALAPITFTIFGAIGSLFEKPPAVTETKALETLKPHAPPGGWPHAGVTGKYDRAALQRGFQVYKQVCSTCHSMKLLSYRDLADLGFNDAEVKALAAGYQVTDGPNDQGDMFQRPGIPSDHFV